MEKRTLYREAYEHDNCGTGALVHIKGKASHHLVNDALLMLERMFHRGGTGKDVQSGDGAGILIGMPHSFFVQEAAMHNVTLGEEKTYAVAVLMSTEEASIDAFSTHLANQNIKHLWTRKVKTDGTVLGEVSYKTMPHVWHVFVDVSTYSDALEMKQSLFMARKQFERDNGSYIASFSNENIIYKGMLNAYQVRQFYLDLQDETLTSHYALVHSRFSTNTFPSWEKAHPYRYLSHNGEINTIKANNIWANALLHASDHAFLKQHQTFFKQFIDANGSDSMQLDEYVEMLTLLGFDLPEIMMILVPESWENNADLTADVQAFYQYYSSIVEPWDGPGNITFTDGRFIGATLDRNGLRPSRYYVTEKGLLILASEVGVLPEIPQADIKVRGRLTPGKMLLVDLERQAILENNDLKSFYAGKRDYQRLIQGQKMLPSGDEGIESLDIYTKKRHFITEDDIQFILKPMVQTGEDALGSMGDDTPLAVFSKKPQHFSHFFRQRFAQVTNPPLDAIREKLVTSAMMYLGRKCDIGSMLGNQNVYKLETPILTKGQMQVLENQTTLKVAQLKSTFKFNQSLENRLEELRQEAVSAVQANAEILVLSDTLSEDGELIIPSVLAVSNVHQALMENHMRTKTSLVIESGEIITVHHAALVLGYGANAIYPYAGYALIDELVQSEKVDVTYFVGCENYRKALTSGMIKVASKMGVSTLRSYHGAQLFEIIGLSKDVANTYFNRTDSVLSGLTIDQIEQLIREHEIAAQTAVEIDFIGKYQQRRNGELHLFNPLVIKALHKALNEVDYEAYKVYASQMVESQKDAQIRGHFDFNSKRKSISVDAVESVESIVKRFRVGAMSYGALSEEAHISLAKAMNQLGAMSNSGEGGEAKERYNTLSNSAIKQVASGRFGVTHEYLMSARELQIKVAQGAKPGEGGQLASHKVYPWIAKVRNTVPGVTLISPPPHHDIYSIEDIEQLIFDLKNVNKEACISVKLVSERGIGTVAAGLAKARAEKIIVSSSDGGTGAANRTSIFHAGLPWEIGLAETHQTLSQNGLRGRVKLEVDGKLLTARDLVIATLLGAEEYAFGTLPLIALGCIMARVCHQDTCPVGITSQNPKLRARQKNTDQQVMTLMRFIAQEMREYMAELGYQTIDEMIGQSEVLVTTEKADAHGLDFTELFVQSESFTEEYQQFHLEKTIDQTTIIPTIQAGQLDIDIHVDNTNRSVLTQTASYLSQHNITEKIYFSCQGIAGQSFAAFTTANMHVDFVGEANDYFGKGLSGATLTIQHETRKEGLIVGNTAFFGATSGFGYVAGGSGERFAVRNSGANLVVEGVGDHGCEYMTGGCVLNIGTIGRNFAAGMSGGVAYIYKPNVSHINQAMVEIEALDEMDEQIVKEMLLNHIQYTESQKAQQVLASFNRQDFVKIIPTEYKLMQNLIREQCEAGYSEEEAALHAFQSRFQK